MAPLRILLLSVLAAGLASAPVQAQEAEGLDAWSANRRRDWRPSAPPEPVTLKIAPTTGFDRTLTQLGREGDWSGVIQALLDRLGQPELREVLVAPRGPEGVLRGAQEDARRRLLGLSLELRQRHYPGLAQAEALAGIEQARRLGSASLQGVLRRYPGSYAAQQALLKLSGDLAEAGERDAALLLLRTPNLDHEPQGRALMLRALPLSGAPQRGDLGLRAEALLELQLLWARPCAAVTPAGVATDSRGIYGSDSGGVFAVSRADGRLRWRVERSRSQPSPRLALGEGGLLLLAPLSLAAHAPSDGRLLWQRELTSFVEEAVERDGFQSAVACEDGWLVLATLNETRTLLALDRRGDTLWRTRLWSAPPPAQGWAFKARRAGRDPAQSSTPESPGEHVVAEPQQSLVSLDDGQLDALADQVFVTWDGMVAALETSGGGLRWARVRTLGRATSGRGAPVGIEAGPFGITAALAGGLVIRLDPLDGSRLRDLPPPAHRDDHREPERYLLSLRPPRFAWRWTETPESVWVAGIAQRFELPTSSLVGPGDWWGASLVVPGRAGLIRLDPASSTSLPWPTGLRASRVWTQTELLLACGEGALLVYGPSRAGEQAPALKEGATAEALVEALGHPSWIRRGAASAELEDRFLRDWERVMQITPPNLEAADSLRRLRGSSLRRARWSRLAPDAPADLRRRLQERPDADSLERGLASIAPARGLDPEAAASVQEDLSAELRSLSGRFELAWPVARTLLRRDPLEQGRVVLEIRQATDAAEALAAGELLVSLAESGGELEPLRRALQHPDETTRAVVVLVVSGKPELRELLGERDWERASRDAIQTLAMRWGGFGPPDRRARTAVRRRLVEALSEP